MLNSAKMYDTQCLCDNLNIITALRKLELHERCQPDY